MSIDILPDSPPLRSDADGSVRIGTGRVLLEVVIRTFHDGATAEEITQRYPTVSLADVYAVIAYYLRHTDAIDTYLAERDGLATSIRQQIEASQGSLSDIRRRILARRIA